MKQLPFFDAQQTRMNVNAFQPVQHRENSPTAGGGSSKSTGFFSGFPTGPELILLEGGMMSTGTSKVVGYADNF